MNRRNAVRMRTLYAGRIAYADGLRSVPCLVRNMSETGVRIEIGEGFESPRRFDLIVPDKRINRSCELVWRQGGALGARFVDEQKKDRIDDVEDQLRKIEAENRRLRRQISPTDDSIY